MKPYRQVPIVECGEPLVPIPLDRFAVEQPHPYVKLAAPYGDRSPYFLRQGVLNRLIEAQHLLQKECPGWRIQIFDAYRPIAVQQYMVDYTFAQLVNAQGMMPEQLTDAQRLVILEQVYQFWAVPSFDPATPPPHSTGAAIDVTLVDAAGRVVDMGSPIDEISPRSHSDYFAPPSRQSEGNQQLPNEVLASAARSRVHQNRQILRQVMIAVGFRQHPDEWWHFSLGDQMWAWLMNQDRSSTLLVACYGAI
jgi:D-alanyl-D-alanine dipeptidase